MAFTPDTSLVERVTGETQRWRQGDAVNVTAVAWLGRPDAALTEQSAALTGDDSKCIVAGTDRLLVVSQTCDLVRNALQRPYVLLAPVVVLQEPSATEARLGTRPRFVPVPGLGTDTFVDLDLIVTAEKSLLLDTEPVRGLPDEAAQRLFGSRVGRFFSRSAFPDDLSIALRGLVARVRDKHAKNSREGQALTALEEIRVLGTPSWDADEIDVFLIFATPTRAEAEELMPETEWDEIVDGWLRRADAHGVVASVDGAMIPFDELTAREYLDSDPLDLDYLSWRQN